jgi:MSHA biogenesis protein MshM
MYEAHFGLAQLPFRLAPDPRFHVDAAPQRAAVLALRDRLRRGDEFIPLVGDFGVGKTTVARRLLQEVRDDHHLTGELPGALLDGEELFGRVTEALGLGPHVPADELIPQLEGLARGGGEALLLVDDAHELAIDALQRLRTLTGMRVDGRAVLHVTLVGRALPAGVEALREAGRPLTFGTPVRLEPLDVAGTREYILQRLARAGWTGRPAFEPDTTAEIHARCNGNPGLINRLCGHLLLQLYMEGRDDLSPDIVRAGDELLRCELEGLPATDKLPPPTRRPPAHPPQASSARPEDDAADVDPPPPPARLPATLRAEAGHAVVPVPAARPWRDRRSRQRTWAQGAVAAAFLLGGGLLANAMIDRRYTRPPATQARAQATLPPVAQAPARGPAPAPAAPVPAAARGRVPAPAPATAPESAQQARADAAVAAAERVLEQAPPGAGPPRAAVDATTTAPPVVDDGPRPRPHAAHKPHPRSTPGVATATSSLAPSTCTLESEALGLCHRAQTRAPATPAAAQALAAARDPTPVVATPSPAPSPAPACEPARATLGLCGQGTRPTP